MADIGKPVVVGDGSELSALVIEAVNKVIAEYKKDVEDGNLSFQEIMGLGYATAQGLVSAVVHIAKDHPDNADRKKCIMDAMGLFYDEIIVPYDIPGIPSIIEGFVDEAGKKPFLSGIEFAIDAMFSLLDKFTKDTDELKVWGCMPLKSA